MKIKEEKGVAGIDISVSIILITIFISIIAVLLFHIQKNEEDIKRKSEAMSYAIEKMEEIKSNGFEKLPQKGTEKIEGYEDQYIVAKDGTITPYYQEIRVKDYSELEGKEDKQAEVLKIVTVNILYKSGKSQEKVEITTGISKEE